MTWIVPLIIFCQTAEATPIKELQKDTSSVRISVDCIKNYIEYAMRKSSDHPQSLLLDFSFYERLYCTRIVSLPIKNPTLDTATVNVKKANLH